MKVIARTKMPTLRLISLTVLILVLARASSAQQATQYDRGTPPQHLAGISPVGSYVSTEVGAINLSNGALNLKLPLGSVGGRGFSIPLTLDYSSKVWSALGDSDAAGGVQKTCVSAFYGVAQWDYDLYNRVAAGWTIGGVPALKAIGMGLRPGTGACNYHFALVKLTLTMPDKGEIQFRDDAYEGEPRVPGTNGSCQIDVDRGPTWHATDGSGAIFVSDPGTAGVSAGDLSGTVVTADGTRYHFTNLDYPGGGFQGIVFIHNLARCDKIEDRNGNFIQITYPAQSGLFKEVDFTDQLGRVTTIRKNAADPDNPGQNVAFLITLPGYQGTPRYYKVIVDTMNLHYRPDRDPHMQVISGDKSPGDVDRTWPTSPVLRLFPTSEGLNDMEIDTQPVVTQLVLPDKRSLSFLYNEFGEVAQVNLPTGASIQYDYNTATLPSGITPSQETQSQLNSLGLLSVDRAVAARRTYEPGSTTAEGTWAYSYGPLTPTNSTATSPATDITCTGGGQLLLHERHFFNPAGRYLSYGLNIGLKGMEGTGYTLWSTGLEFRTETLDANLSLLRATESTWHQRAGPTWTGGYLSFVGETQEEPEFDNRTTENRTFLDDGSMAKVDTTYDDSGAAPNANNPATVDEYDFGGAQKRHVVATYQYYANPGIHLVRLPVQHSVYDKPPESGGTLFAQTTYEYDNYTPEQQPPINHQALQDYTTVVNHDPGYPATFLQRGNPTKITQSGVPSAVAYPRYDILGNVVSTKDPNTNVTTISFSDDFGDGHSPGSGTSSNTFAYPTKITSPPVNTVSQTAYSQYDSSTGLLTGFKDRNGIITQTKYNDLFDRPTEIIAALGNGTEAHTHMYYAPAAANGVSLVNEDMMTAKAQVTKDDQAMRSWTHTDGFGRVLNNFTLATEHDIQVDSGYDALGRKVQVSNPYRSGYTPPGSSTAETALFTTTTYDMAGRVIQVQSPDGAIVGTAFNGPNITVTDQAANQRKSVIDGLGRLVKVFEDPAGKNYETDYQYDPLDDLTKVTQVGQSPLPNMVRNFTYDGLKRLMSAQNPESGTVSYQYDNSGNLIQKNDARGVQINYVYDVLNRVTQRNYTTLPASVAATANVTYTYDTTTQGTAIPNAVGRLTSIASTVSSYTHDQFDELGRVLQSTQNTGGNPYQMNYGYDLAGEMTSETYPSRTRVVNTQYDAAGRITQLQAGTTTYASTFQYAAHGAVSQVTLGNSLVEKTTFNNRLQPTEIMLGPSGNVLDLQYFYTGTCQSQNNGNLIEQIIKVNGTAVGDQTYCYDKLNRLASATETYNTTTSWARNFNYDQFGNMWVTGAQVILPTAATPQASTAYTPGTNQLASPAAYDSAGNQTFDLVGNHCVYDGENRLTDFSNGTGGYTYDGDGRRVTKTASAGTSVFVYDIAGRLIAEYGGPTSTSNAGTSYLTTDHLGSTRVVTNSLGNVVARHDYLPFGDEILTPNIGGRTPGMGYGGVDDTRQKFTSKEIDSESALYYFRTRYYSNALGRFTSADRPFAGQYRGNPQSWDLYVYVLDDPLDLIDPFGLHHVDASGNEVGDKDGETYQGLVWNAKKLKWVNPGATSSMTVRPKPAFEVIFWSPSLAHVASVAGHVSYIINGESWSWERGGWHKQPDYELYLRENTWRNGIGVELGIDDDPDFAQRLGEAVSDFNADSYNLITANCGEAFREAVTRVGLPPDSGVAPVEHEEYVRRELKPYIRAVHFYREKKAPAKAARPHNESEKRHPVVCPWCK